MAALNDTSVTALGAISGSRSSSSSTVKSAAGYAFEGTVWQLACIEKLLYVMCNIVSCIHCVVSCILNNRGVQ
jgi:hypothetical protein